MDLIAGLFLADIGSVILLKCCFLGSYADIRFAIFLKLRNQRSKSEITDRMSKNLFAEAFFDQIVEPMSTKASESIRYIQIPSRTPP